jgi:hypothetical protein
VRKALAIGLLWFLGLAGFGSVSKLFACETCKSFLGFYGHCAAVAENETGYTQCATVPSLDGTTCIYSGDFCSSITVTGSGSGGGGTGGGGGSTCTGNGGFCPAECFSCGGGGGGPLN